MHHGSRPRRLRRILEGAGIAVVWLVLLVLIQGLFGMAADTAAGQWHDVLIAIGFGVFITLTLVLSERLHRLNRDGTRKVILIMFMIYLVWILIQINN